MRDEVKAKKDNGLISDIEPIEQLTKRANLEIIYQSVYRLYFDDTHVSVNSIEKYIAHEDSPYLINLRDTSDLTEIQTCNILILLTALSLYLDLMGQANDRNVFMVEQISESF
ncbi:DUF5677 domain-containing protein [Sporomusa sphaeroides]